MATDCKDIEKKGDDLELKLLAARSVMLYDEISKKSANDVVKRMLVLDNEGKDPIRLFINSPGGDIDAGFQIFDIINFLRSPVLIICNGLVASAATLVLLATDKKNRLSLPHSRFLIHQPSSGIEGSVSDIEIYAKEIEKLRHRLNGIIHENTGQPLDRVERDTNRDTWMDAAQALEYGLITRIVGNVNEI